MEQDISYRGVFAILGALIAHINPALPYIGIATTLILIDCLTAYNLSRRVKERHKGKTTKHDGKFVSRNFAKVLTTMLKSWTMILIAYFMQLHITSDTSVDLTKIAAGAICFWQIWSILENESSCSDAKWAKIAQKILVDKTSRHLNIDLTDLNNTDKIE